MPDSALGQLLKDLRAERGLTLRETGQLAEMDHAYIHRLETGAREAPSEEALVKLTKALKAPKREADMIRYLATHTEVDPGLVAHVYRDDTVSFDVFAAAASASFRGPARPDYAKLIARIQRILEDEDDGG